MSLLNCIYRNLEKFAQDEAFIALKSLEADLKFRIHNKGEKTRGRIGNYQTDSWIKARRERGLQTRYVDLQFSGKLSRELTTGQSRGDAVLGFTSDLSKAIHDGQEERRGPIWKPNRLEQRDLAERFSDGINKRIRNCQ